MWKAHRMPWMPLHRNMVAEAIIVADPPQHHLAIHFFLQEVPATPPTIFNKWGWDLTRSQRASLFDILPLRSLILFWLSRWHLAKMIRNHIIEDFKIGCSREMQSQCSDKLNCSIPLFWSSFHSICSQGIVPIRAGCWGWSNCSTSAAAPGLALAPCVTTVSCLGQPGHHLTPAALKHKMGAAEVFNSIWCCGGLWFLSMLNLLTQSPFFPDLAFFFLLSFSSSVYPHWCSPSLTQPRLIWDL